MSILDTAVLVRDFEHCHILEVLQEGPTLYLVQANYNDRIVETTHDLEDAVDIAVRHDEEVNPQKSS
jgi:hypothetical protein